MNSQTTPENPIRILLVDDHAVVREGLVSALRSYPHIQVVGEAVDGVDAINKVINLRPDIVVMDVNMPNMNGLDATRHLVNAGAKVKILALTVHDSREYVLELVRAGACGYLLKESSPQDFIRAIEAVHGGSSFFSAKVTQYVLDDYVSGTLHNKKLIIDSLSPREREVLSLIAEGLTNKEIAQRLGVAVRTIETHRERLMRKLDVHSIAELVKYAVSAEIGRESGDPQRPTP